MLEILSFTGVDIKTDSQALLALADEFPLAEFAVLVGSSTGEDHPLFPPLDVVERLKSMAPNVRTALHLCGKYARATMQEDSLTPDALSIAEGFGRVQINLHGDHITPRTIAAPPDAIRHFADTVRTERVILQHRADWDSIPLDHPRVEYLFDLSEGSGQESFTAWPEPPVSRRVGYAGGIGPHNISTAMDFVDLHPRAHIWLDMESQVRTPAWWLDLQKVRAVCRAAFAAPRNGDTG